MKKYYSYFLLCALLLQACSKSLPLPEVKTEKKIVLLGELIANENPYIRAGQSISISSNTNAKIELLTDINVKIADESGNETYLNGEEDDLSPSLHTIPYTGNLTLQPLHTYVLTASQKDLGTAIVNVPIPQPFSANLIDVAETQYAGSDVVRFTIQIDDPNGDDLYAIECLKQQIDVQGEFLYNNNWLDIPTNIFLYDSLKNENQNITTRYDTTFYNVFDRQYLFSNDPNSENLRDNTTTSSYRRILFRDDKFKGQHYTTQVYVRKDNFGSAFQNGQFVLSIKSVSKEYFNYLGQYEGVAGYSYTTSNIPSSMKGNIANGLGIVGGVYKIQFNYVIDDIFPY